MLLLRLKLLLINALGVALELALELALESALQQGVVLGVASALVTLGEAKVSVMLWLEVESLIQAEEVLLRQWEVAWQWEAARV